MTVTATELERLTVRLVGEGSNYQKVLDEAVAATEQAAVKIDAITKNEMASQNTAMEEAARITRAVALPTEMYMHELEELGRLYKSGHLGLTSYTRALKKASDALPRTQERQAKLKADLQKTNAAMEDAARITRAVATPTERYAQEVAELGRLHKAGHLGLTAYTRALKKAQSVLPSTQRAQARYNADLQRAKEITNAARGPMERYQKELADIDRLYKKNMISGAAYHKTVDKLNKEFGRGSHAMGAFGNKLKNAGRGMRNFGMMASFGVTLPVVGMGLAFTKAAADAEETKNKFDVVFSSVAAAANASAEELDRSFGMAADEAKDLLSNTGDLLTGFGFAQKSALDLSTRVQKLATDLASFVNLEGGTARASEALTKALLGETEQAKALGIVIRQDSEEFIGFVKHFKEVEGMTLLQAKAMAALEIATKQSKNAMGDYARSQYSLTNQFRELKADISDLAVQLGNILMPMVKRLVAALRGAVDWMRKLDPTMASIIILMVGIAAAIGLVVLGIGLMTIAIGQLTIAFGYLTIAGAAWVVFGLLIVAAVWAVTDALTDANLGFLDFVNSIKIGGVSIGTRFEVLSLRILQAWNWVTTGITKHWESLKLSLVEIGAFIYRGFLAITNSISNAFWVSVKGIVDAFSWLTEKALTTAFDLHLIDNQEYVDGLHAIEAMNKGIEDSGKDAAAAYKNAIDESLGTSEKRWAEYHKTINKLDKDAAKESAILKKLQTRAFLHDAAGDAKGALDKGGVKGVDGGAGDATNALKTGKAKATNFKQISLHNISLAGTSGNRQPKKQKVEAPGVEKELQNIAGILERQNMNVAVAG